MATPIKNTTTKIKKSADCLPHENGDQNYNPVEHVHPHQPKARLPVIKLSPFRDYRYDTHRNGQKLAIADKRPIRHIRVGHPCHCQREYGEEG